MGKSTLGGFYAVAIGRQVGIFLTWAQCEAQVKGFSNARFQKFTTKAKAEAFMKEYSNSIPPMPTAATDVASASIAGQIASANASSHASATAPTTTRKRRFQVSDGSLVTGVKLLKVATNIGVNLTGFNVDDDDSVLVFTASICEDNASTPARVGVWFGDGHVLNVSRALGAVQCKRNADIKTAEIAILQAKSVGITKLRLRTASKFILNCLNTWKKGKNAKLSTGQEDDYREYLGSLDDAMKGMEISWPDKNEGSANQDGFEKALSLAVAADVNNSN